MSFHEPKHSSFTEILRHYLADIVYGGNDGIVTTFAVISGVVGANLSLKAMFVITTVSLFADGFSMAASNFLAIRSKAEAHGLSRGTREPLAHAMATFVSFILFGSMPLFGFFLYSFFPVDPFAMSALVTAMTMFVLGGVRSIVSNRRWYMTGFENLLIGAVASIVAFYGGMMAATLVEHFH
jgi:VIT1/CCC1 family predicted Fe2+/Mn2+ transporter